MLYLVGLPVGNWEDMPKRNFELLRNAKYLVVENQENFNIIKSNLALDNIIQTFYIGSMGKYDLTKEPETFKIILELLKSGEDVYVISDDGMPGIADPGEMITRETINHGFTVSATPGPSAIIAAASVAGCQHNFSFEAFLPEDKKERAKAIQIKSSNQAPMIFMLVNIQKSRVYEVLDQMVEKWGNRNGVLCYNLTTSKETTVRGDLLYLRKYHEINSNEDDLVMLVVDGSRPMLSMPKAL
jgi:16S rRNA (cytidine1402-2'-O)-methyltransferase